MDIGKIYRSTYLGAGVPNKRGGINGGGVHFENLTMHEYG